MSTDSAGSRSAKARSSSPVQSGDQAPMQLAQRLFATAAVGFAVVALDQDAEGQVTHGRIMAINDHLLRLRRMEPSDARGRRLEDVLPEAECDQWITIFQTVIDKQQPRYVEVYAHGPVRWLAVTVSPMADDRISLVVDDVTERKQVETELRESKLRFDIALEAGHFGSWRLDLPDLAMSCTATCKSNFGLPPEQELPYQRLGEMIAPEYRRQWQQAVVQAIEQGEDFKSEYQVRWPNGEIHWISATGRALYTRAGTPYRMVGVTQDITEQKTLEETLRQNEARQRFLVELNDALRPLSVPEAVAETAGRLLAEQCAASRVQLIEIAASPGEQTRVVRGEYRVTSDAVMGYRQLGVFAQSLTELLQQTGSLIVTDTQQDVRLSAEQRDMCQAMGVRAVASVAVGRRDAISLVLIVGTSDCRDWSDNDATLLQAVAERAGATIERTRAEVTARRSRMALARQAKNYDMILSTIEDNIFHLDDVGRILYANRKLLDSLGLAPGEEKGKTLYELNISPELRRVVLADVKRVFATGQSIRDESEYTSVTGATGYYDYIMNPVFATDGTVEYVVGSARDITQRKRAQEASEQAERRKDEFLATLAHELRNPLAAAQNAQRLISQESEDNSWAAGMLGRQLDHMGRLVDDLLDVSRVSRDLIELQKQRLDLTALVQQEIESLERACRDQGHELHVVLPSESLYMDADATRLQQIIGNLVNNAAKFSDRGSRIDCTLASDPDGVSLRVRDYGIGMTQEQIPRIFDLFMQAGTALEHSRSGLGLGLTLSKRLAELHGGEIEARSEGLGRGSEFTLRLPMAADLAPVQADEDEPQQADVPSRRMLLVDDNNAILDSMKLLLELDGHDVYVASEGYQAVEAAERIQPEVILLDIGLPGLNGYQVCSRIRQQPWGQGIFIIAATGWGQPEYQQRSAESGFDAHLVKPIDETELARLLYTLSA